VCVPFFVFHLGGGKGLMVFPCVGSDTAYLMFCVSIEGYHDEQQFEIVILHWLVNSAAYGRPLSAFSWSLPILCSA
jgi:hypothetical protein